MEKGLVVCLSPNVTKISTVSSEEDSFDLKTMVHLDGFSTDFSDIPVVPDPVFDKFPGGVRVVNTDDLILTVSLHFVYFFFVTFINTYTRLRLEFLGLSPL